MEILDPKDKNRLLAIDRLRKFVKDEEPKYLKILKDLKKELPKGAQLTNPRLLAAYLAAYLMMYDLKLCNLMWAIWGDDVVRIKEFYDIIGKYFVDREAAA